MKRVVPCVCMFLMDHLSRSSLVRAPISSILHVQAVTLWFSKACFDSG